VSCLHFRVRLPQNGRMPPGSDPQAQAGSAKADAVPKTNSSNPTGEKCLGPRSRLRNRRREVSFLIPLCRRVRAPKRLSGLPVFDSRLNVPVRRFDERSERCLVWYRSRSQLHMTHVLTSALQQAEPIRQRCPLKESHVNVRCEYVDIAKGRISQACSWTAVM
jgi:hypothetical protein